MSSAPSFIDRDPVAITNELIAEYEAMSGRTLYPAQVERLMINLIAYRENLIREAIQDAAQLNLVRFSRVEVLDELGALVGCERLPAIAATVRLTFELSAAAPSAVLIPSSTRVETSDGAATFATLADVVLPAGALQIDIDAQCTSAGIGGNGWPVGSISTLVDPIAEVSRVYNTASPNAGADEEDDDHYKDRILLAPEAYTTAGSRGAYTFHAKSAHQDIIDVAVLGPTTTNDIPPGTVRIYPLLKSGLPDAAMLDLVLQKCSGEKVRPLCDTVEALVAPLYSYRIDGALTLYRTADADDVLKAARAAIDDYVAGRSGNLGRDVVPGQITGVLTNIAGVYDAELTMTSRLVVPAHGWANCEGVELTLAGVVDG